MILLFISFLAGMLTVLAPCTLPLLPIIFFGGAQSSDKLSWRRPLFIILGLSLSVIIFTLLLRATTALLGVPQLVWQTISGGIITLLGFHLLFPHIWQMITVRARATSKSEHTLTRARTKKGDIGAFVTGAALGPVFNSCSPTYALIVAAILPSSFGLGVLYLIAYTFGMSVVLLLVAYFGARLTRKLGWAINPNGLFHKIAGVVFIAVGLAIIFHLDKSLQTFLLEQGWYDGATGLEKLIKL